MNSRLRTVSRTSRTGWDAARWRGSQPQLSISLKAKVCVSISLSTNTSPGNETRAQHFIKEKKKQKHSRLTGAAVLDGILDFCSFLETLSTWCFFHAINCPSRLSAYLHVSVGLPASWCLAVLTYSCWACDFWLRASEERQQNQTRRQHSVVMMKVFPVWRLAYLAQWQPRLSDFHPSPLLN